MDIAASFTQFPPLVLFGAALVLFCGGVIKGAVGFALPMIAVAGIGSFLSAQETLALMILPVFVSNLWQTLRQGIRPAVETGRRFWKMILLLAGLIVVVGQVVPDIPSHYLFLVLGAVVSIAAILQLAGWRPLAPVGRGARAALECAVGAFAGICGGLSGVWGPPVMFYLVSLRLPRAEQVRAQGLTFFVGSVMLVIAHIKSGLLDAATIPSSALMILPAAAGMAIGVRMQDAMHPERFRKVTLAVLCVAGLNLLRRGLF